MTTRSYFLISLALSISVQANGAEYFDAFVVRGNAIFSVSKNSSVEVPILSSYEVTSNETANLYKVSFREAHCRRGVSLYFTQALDSIPAIHGYDLEYSTPLFIRPLGYIFRTQDGYFVEYLSETRNCNGIHVSTMLEGSSLLPALHEIQYLMGEVISDNMAVNN
jgi:hypothetical protein